MSLKEVKNKIKSVKKIRQVTRAMEAVSAVKMRRSQETAIEARPFALHGLSILRRITTSMSVTDHVLIKPRAEVKNIGFVVVTSDKGLAGALNSYVFRETHKRIKESGLAQEHIHLVTVGKKAYEHFHRRGFHIMEHIEGWGEGVALGDPLDLSQTVINAFLSGVVDVWDIVYTNFHSTFKQEPVTRKLVPVSFTGLADTIEGIIPERGKYAELRMLNGTVPHEYLFEPGPKEVLDELLPYLIAVELYHAIVESNASEHSARMVAMKSASDRARDLVKDLTLDYNKARQGAITAEVSEITSGIEAMR
jgi:F-type H+-transporting ATPase subunit gamma